MSIEVICDYKESLPEAIGGNDSNILAKELNSIKDSLKSIKCSFDPSTLMAELKSVTDELKSLKEANSLLENQIKMLGKDFGRLHEEQKKYNTVMESLQELSQNDSIILNGLNNDIKELIKEPVEEPAEEPAEEPKKKKRVKKSKTEK